MLIMGTRKAGGQPGGGICMHQRDGATTDSKVADGLGLNHDDSRRSADLVIIGRRGSGARRPVTAALGRPEVVSSRPTTG